MLFSQFQDEKNLFMVGDVKQSIYSFVSHAVSFRTQTQLPNIKGAESISRVFDFG
ncbi:MAG: UvrD-helicase domain-containing protein [Acutalibacteraceae bacterium]